MAKPRVFLSFDYDKGFKNNFVAQTKRQELPFAINDISIQEDDPEWQQKARSSIEDCDVFIVLLGENVKGGVKTYQRGGAKLYH